MIFQGGYHMTMALLRPATQSSTQGGNVAKMAVDGNLGSWAITSHGDTRPWWKVHLPHPVWVILVEINYYNRE